MALPQPLHIFRKDLIHLWPETVVALILFVAFAWSAPSGWTHSQYAGVIALLAAFLHLLMPISWLVVISRLIHDETLVGDRQFWTSRPYHWGSLLAAKLLYLVAFLYVPFFLMQVYLLKHAGLYPTTVLPALLHNLLLLTVIIVVPLTAIAAVTSTFARMLLAVLGGIIYLIVLAAVVGFMIFQRMSPPALEPTALAVLILLPAIALVYQYMTRRTTVARLMLIVTPVVAGILLLLTPATALIRHAYPVATAADAPKLSKLPDGLGPTEAGTGRLRVERNQVLVGLPVTVTGADDKSNYMVKGVAATIDAPGVHWSSPYNTAFGQEINAYNPVALVGLAVPMDVFNKLGNGAADVHLSIAAEHLKASDPSTWKATLQPFSVPGHGICSYSQEDPDEPPTCRYPLVVPELNFVTAQVTAGSCSDPAAPKVPRRANLSAGPSTLDFDPVLTVPLSFRSRDAQGQADRTFLCPGTPLEFIQAKPEGNTRLEVDLKQIKLALYASRISDRSAQPAGPGSGGGQP